MANSGTLTVRVDEGRRRRFDAALDSSEAESESELLRELIDLGLDEKGQGLYRRLGCTDKLAARIEELREPGESKQEAVARLLRDAVESRDTDHTKRLLGDNLRDRVDALADEGEPIDDAARRLLREGAEAKESENEPVYSRISNVVAVLFLFTIPILYASQSEFYYAFGLSIIYALIIEFGDEINNQFARLKGLTGRVVP